jgi:dihydropteroate synthase
MSLRRSAASWELGPGQSLSLERPRVIAALNATPDSFYSSSRLPGSVGPSPSDHFGSTSSRDGAQGLRQRLKAVLAERPDMIDVGGQSTRPGSARVPPAEERARVIPVLQTLRELSSEVPISIDTYSAEVAAAALDAGATVVNDISAGSLDPELWPLVASRGCAYVLMHMQGQPETMQREPSYVDVLREVGSFLEEKLAQLAEAGVPRERVAVDPGIGFGKRVSDNLDLIRGAARFHSLGCPLYYGVSRKSFIGMLPGVNSGASDAEGRLPGTLGASWALMDRGVMLHRVHDVSALRQLCALWEALRASDED